MNNNFKPNKKLTKEINPKNNTKTNDKNNLSIENSTKHRILSKNKRPFYNNKEIEKLIGNTPIINIDGIFVKLELFNPTGSIKDRMVWYMTKKAEQRNELRQGMKIIEVTSGNTGISFSMISSLKDYDFIAVMPESMSIERRKMMKAFGATIILTDREKDMLGSLEKYNELIKQRSDVWLPRQFDNLDNPEAYEKGFALEIISQIDKEIDAFVACVGTGGTLIGTAKALKKRYPYVKIIGIEPEESAILSGKKPGIHRIQGIGEGFIPKILKDNMNIIDEILTIKSDDAIKESKEIARKHGLLVGISSGANLLAAKRIKNKYKTIVTLFPDRGERYLSEIHD